MLCHSAACMVAICGTGWILVPSLLLFDRFEPMFFPVHFRLELVLVQPTEFQHFVLLHLFGFELDAFHDLLGRFPFAADGFLVSVEVVDFHDCGNVFHAGVRLYLALGIGVERFFGRATG